MSLNQKSQIIKIIQKDELKELDKTKLISIFSKLPTEQLISLLGEDFKKHTQNYTRWGSDYDLFEELLQNPVNINIASQCMTGKTAH